MLFRRYASVILLEGNIRSGLFYRPGPNGQVSTSRDSSASYLSSIFLSLSLTLSHNRFLGSYGGNIRVYLYCTASTGRFINTRLYTFVTYTSYGGICGGVSLCTYEIRVYRSLTREKHGGRERGASLKKGYHMHAWARASSSRAFCCILNLSMCRRNLYNNNIIKNT